MGADTEITLEGVVTDRHYWDNDESGRDGLVKEGNLSVTRYFDNRKLALQAGIGYADFDADASQFGYQGPEIYAGIIVEAWRNGIVYARAGYTGYDFDGTEPGFGISRDDDESRYSLGFQHDFKSGALDGWALQGSWVYTDNSSNVPIYEYDRHVVNLGLQRSF